MYGFSVWISLSFCYVCIFRKVYVYSLGWAIMGRTRKGSTNGMPAPMSGCGYLRPRPSLQAPSTPLTSTQIHGWPGTFMLFIHFAYTGTDIFPLFFCFLCIMLKKPMIYVHTFICFSSISITVMCLRGWSSWVISCCLRCSHCYSWRSGTACTQGTSSASPWSSSLSMWRSR